jgi:hypothetical protein
MSTVAKLLVLGVLVAGFNMQAANPPVLMGKFTLDSLTRWGSATLPAGDYSFTVDKNYAGSTVTVFHGTQIVARVQAAGIKSIKSGRSEIVMENGEVREVNLPTIGVSLHYPAHNPHHGAAPQEMELARIIPATAASAGR